MRFRRRPPNHETVWAWLNREFDDGPTLHTSREHSRLSKLFQELGSVDGADALDLASRLLDRTDRSSWVWPYIANAVAYLIAVLGVRDRYKEADRLSTAALTNDPGNVAFVETRGCVLAVLGNGDEAIPMLQRGLAALRAGITADDRALGWCHMFLARAHLDAGDPDRSRRHATEAALAGAESPVLEALLAELWFL